MNRVYPNLTGLIDPKIENELMRFITNLYEQIENVQGTTPIANRAQSPSATATPRTLDTQQRNSPVGLANKLFAQPVIGEGSDPNVKGVTPDDVIHSNMNIIAGAVPVGGYITVHDGFGNSVDVLVK